jgi:hypothetical protein
MASKRRVVLNLKIAREIESLAPTFADRMRRGGKSQLSYALAERFGVDPKTIRDIWNRKSWGEGGRRKKKGVSTATTDTTTTTTTTATTITTTTTTTTSEEEMGIFIIADSFLRDAEW